MFKSKGIQFKLVGVILVVIAVAISGLATATYLSTRDVIVSNTDQQLRNDTGELAEDIALWIEMKKGEVAAIAASPVVAGGNREEILRYITAEVKRLDGYELILVGDAKGEYFTSNMQTANNADRDYFKKVVATGEAYVSDPLVARTTKHNVIIVAVPIFKEGKIAGVVGGSVRLESIEKRLKAVKIGKEGFAYLMQGDGLVVTHPDSAYSMKKNLLTDPGVDSRLKTALERAVKGQTVVGRYLNSASDKEQYVGFTSINGTNNWVIGITVPVEEVWAPLSRLNLIFTIATILILLVTGVVIKWFLSSAIIKPLEELKTMIDHVAAGDLTVRGKPQADDELGRLTTTFNHTLDTLCQMIQRIHTSTGDLKSASVMLQEIAGALAENSQTMCDRTNVAETAVKEILSRMDSTSHATEETGNNITSIAAAVEEMAATTASVVMVAEAVSSKVESVRQVIEGVYINTDRVSSSAGDMSAAVEQVVQAVQEINLSISKVKTNCEHSVHITLGAKDFAQEASRVIGELSNSSKKIYNIVSIISNIASQTSMLALNATIEAASAGEAGKGFAVVASEVKELAQRTAKATVEIGQQLEEMQDNMHTAVKAVDKITQVIYEITDITGTIGTAITEQSSAIGHISESSLDAGKMVNLIAKEIMTVNDNCKQASQNADEAAHGVAEITQSITELAQVTNSIALNVEAVSMSMESVVESGQQILTKSDEISFSASEVTKISLDTSNRSEETMQAAESLVDTAEHLDKLVKVFKI